jgi:hypothetical protein
MGMRGLIAMVAGLGLLCSAAGAAAAPTVSPLPASNYGVRSVCAPPAFRRASCLSLQLVPLTAAARARTHPLGFTHIGTPQPRSPGAGDFGLRPQDLHAAYQLPTASASTQTVAIVDAYHDLSAEADLQEYGQTFALGECTGASGCFRQVNQNGETGAPPFPRTKLELEAARLGTPEQHELAESAERWALEISLDIEVVRAVCQNCRILLVEARSPGYEDLERAERTAISLGANEVSNSWGGPEAGVTPALESASPFNHPGVVITASSGDFGYLGWDAETPAERGYVEFPASSPHVVAVGGTRLSLGAGASWTGESVWNGNGAGGGGCSAAFTAQPWQQGVADWSGVGCAAKRAIADVAADADPYTGFAVHDSSPECEASYEEAGVKHVLPSWCTLGGTSLSSPLLASVFALAGGAGGVRYPARTVYENETRSPASLHDVTLGSNGECASGFDVKTGLASCTPAEEAQASCSSRLICLAGPGYDGPSGVGTPNGIGAFQPTGEPEEVQKAQAPSAPPVSAPAQPAVTGTPPGAPARVVVPTVSRLGLTLRALIALNRGRARVSQLGFVFYINLPARVRVTLAKQVKVHRRKRWQPLRTSLTFLATYGPNGRSLSGRGVLSPGLYRLTAAPEHGIAGSMLFHIG